MPWKPNFAFLKVPQWVNGRREGEYVTDEQFTRWGLRRHHSLEGVGGETKNRLKRHLADVESRSWKPVGEILVAHVGKINQFSGEIDIKIYQASGELWGDFTYRDHQCIEDLYVDLLPHSFVRAIRDEDGKDINMGTWMGKYKSIIIEARAIGPRPGPGAGRVQCRLVRLSK